MWTRNRTVLVASGVALAVVAVAAALYFAYSMIHDSTQGHFAQVKDGMTLRQVVRIMGEPNFDQQEPNGSLLYGWIYEETTQAVVVYTRDGVTIRKKPFDDVGPAVSPDMATPWKHIDNRIQTPTSVPTRR